MSGSSPRARTSWRIGHQAGAPSSSEQRAQASRPPEARILATSSSARRVLPIPAGPVRTSQRVAPPRTSASSSSSTRVSRARPTRDDTGSSDAAASATASGVWICAAPVQLAGRGHAASAGSWRRIATCNSRSSAPGSSPSSSSRRRTCSAYRSSASGERPARCSAIMCSQHARSRSGCAARSSCAAASAGVTRPAASSAVICVSRHSVRSSSTASASARTHAWSDRSSSNSPRHSASAASASRQRVRPALLLRGRPRGARRRAERRHVHPVGGDLQHVPLRAAYDRRARSRGVAQRAAQVGHVRLDRGLRAGRRLVTPQRVDQPVRGHLPAAVEQQQRERRPLLGRAEIDDVVAAERRQRAEQPVGRVHVSRGRPRARGRARSARAPSARWGSRRTRSPAPRRPGAASRHRTRCSRSRLPAAGPGPH